MSSMRVIKIKKVALILGACSTLGALTFLTACSNDLKPASQSVNNLSYDSSSNYQPVPNQSSLPVPVIAEINPASIPGQKMPMPSSHSASNNADAHINTVTLESPAESGSSSSSSSSSSANSGVISARAAAQTPAQTPAPAAAPPACAPPRAGSRARPRSGA